MTGGARFGDVVREARRRKRWSQEALAAAARISEKTVRRASARDPLARNGTTSSPCGSWTARSADTTASPSTKPKRSTTRPSTERAGCRVGTPGRSVAGDRAWK